jgi:hypothetical protein
MLRYGPAIALVLTCLTSIILLEYFYREAQRKQGFSTNDKTAMHAARYCPTIGVILLGFAWKTLIRDIKVIMPYVAMSQKWIESRDSLLLDYIDPLEFMSVWRSAQNQHWLMFMVLIGGLISGLLVPLANSLTFIDLSSPVSSPVGKDTGLTKATQFSFNNTLSTPNGTLYMPWNFLGQQPYAAVVSSRQPNGINPPFTTNDFAFESFNTSQWSKINASISTTAQAFNAPFDCTIINYDIKAVGGDWYLSAKAADLAMANCSLPLAQFPYQDPANAMVDMGWLNITTCSQDGTDLRMLATVISNPSSNDAKPLGLMCQPRYFLHQADIQMNASTDSILGLSLNSNTSQPIDIGAGVPAIITYLNFPLDPASQTAYLGVIRDGPSPSFRIPQATFYNVTQYAHNYYGRDPFFNQLLTGSRNASDYISDPTLFNFEVSSLQNTILTQVVSSFARKAVEVPSTGSIIVYQPRLLVRESPLRAMQAILGFLGLVSGISSVLRPRSKLLEDPTSIAAASILLAQTQDTMKQKLREIASMDMPATDEALRNWRWNLSSRQGNKHEIGGVEFSEPIHETQIRVSHPY